MDSESGFISAHCDFFSPCMQRTIYSHLMMVDVTLLGAGSDCFVRFPHVCIWASARPLVQPAATAFCGARFCCLFVCFSKSRLTSGLWLVATSCCSHSDQWGPKSNVQTKGGRNSVVLFSRGFYPIAKSGGGNSSCCCCCRRRSCCCCCRCRCCCSPPPPLPPSPLLLLLLSSSWWEC